MGGDPPASQHSHNPLSLRYISFSLVMRYPQIFVAFVLVAVPLVILATPHSLHWDKMRSKHSWSAIPEDWECSGTPPIGTTLNLHVALKPRREKALIHALYEVSTPGNPKYTFSVTFSHTRTHVSRCSDADIVHTSPESRSPNLSLHIRTLSSSSIPGSSIAAYPPLPSQCRMVVTR